VDPLSVDWDTLHRWVVALPGFADDPRLKDPVRLEEIQREWLEEVLAHG
jgi:FeS assembly protein IscX